MRKILLMLLSISDIFTNAFCQQTAMIDIKILGTEKSDGVYKEVVNMSDGGFIIKCRAAGDTGTMPVCQHARTGYYETQFWKYNAQGDTVIWKKCYSNKDLQDQPDTSVSFLFPAGDGGFYVIGESIPPLNPYDAFLGKEDASGKLQWMGRGFGKMADLKLETAVRAADGGFFAAFTSNYAGGDVVVHYGSWAYDDTWIVKLDSIGNLLWSKTIGGSWPDIPTRIIPTSDGGCFLAGYTASYDYYFAANSFPGDNQYYLFRLDDTGGVKWSKIYGGSGSDVMYDACANGKGGVLMCGESSSQNGDVINNVPQGGMWVLNVDGVGNALWSNCYTVGGIAYRIACNQTDGSIWVTGLAGNIGRHVDIAYGYGDIWVGHIDQDGNFLNSKVMGTINKEDKGANMINVLSNNTVITGGSFFVDGISGGDFPVTRYGGTSDAYLARFAPWTTGINEKKQKLNYIVYPNPAHKTITIRFKETLLKYDVRLESLDGKLLYKANVRGEKQHDIDVSRYSKGILQLRIMHPTKDVAVEKIMIQ